MTKRLSGALLALAVASMSWAQSSSTAALPATTSSASEPLASSQGETQTLSTGLPSFFQHPQLMLGFKSYNNSGRPRDFDDAKGFRFKSKNEYFLGVKSKAGFGVFGQAVETAKQYGNSDKNRFSPGDPSITFIHPVYENSRLKITGSLREYFPVGDYSQSVNQYQQAYYNNITYKMANRVDLFNQLIPRNFVQSKYADGDTKFYVEDYTVVTRPLTNWLRLGAGQHFQYEVHPVTPTGTTLEVFPMADFLISKTIYLGPRVYFPVAVQNSVYDAPKKVSLSEAQAELVFSATL